MDTGAEARLVACFTLIVAMLLGAWAALEQLLMRAFDANLEVVRLCVALVPWVVTGVAVQSARASQAPWARTLGGATVILGVLASIGGGLYFLGNT